MTNVTNTHTQAVFYNLSSGSKCNFVPYDFFFKKLCTRKTGNHKALIMLGDINLLLETTLCHFKPVYVCVHYAS